MKSTNRPEPLLYVTIQIIYEIDWKKKKHNIGERSIQLSVPMESIRKLHDNDKFVYFLKKAIKADKMALDKD